MKEAFVFIKYVFKEAWREVMDFLKDVVSLRPKTLVYLLSICFIIAWLTGNPRASMFFLVGFVVALVYKHWVGGEWRHEMKKQVKEKGAEQRMTESANTDRSSSSLPQIKR